MKKNFLTLFFLLSLDLLVAQQDLTLPGLVVEQNSKYRTGSIILLSNAEIKSASAKPQRSDANGKFTLLFADRPGGDVVRIFVDKSGYEVVNEEELKQATVIGRLKPLKIVMCPAGQLYENQIVYYNIAKDASLAAYERDIATLQKEGKEKEQLMAKLQAQFKQDIKTKEEATALLDKQRQLAEQQAKELADKWVTINLDDESPTYRRAFAAFETKNIKLAKAILDSVDLEKRLALNSSEMAKEKSLRDTLQKNIGRREEEILLDINMCLLNARLRILDNEWAEAEQMYDLAVKYDTGNFAITIVVANFMNQQNEFTKARIYYEKAIAQSKDSSSQSKSFTKFGLFLQHNNDMNGAQKAYEEALQIQRKLAEKNPNIYLPDVASILVNFGLSLHMNNNINEAEKVYEEALQIRRKLAKKNPDLYLSDVATTLDIWAVFLFDNFDVLGTLKAYEEALNIRRKLAKKNPDLYLLDVAESLINLSIVLECCFPWKKNEGANARDEAMDIYTKLLEKNPSATKSRLAMFLYNLATSFYAKKSIDGMKIAYETSLLIKKKIAEKNPKAYNLDVAETEISIGRTYEELLKTTGDMSLKKEGLDLMDDATQRLDIFQKTHPLVQQYLPEINRLTQLFTYFDEASFKLNQQLPPITSLEEKNKVETDPLQKVLRQLEILRLYFEIEKSLPTNNKEIKKLIATTYGDLAWYQLFDKQFNEAEKSSHNGLEKDTSVELIFTNLALALLYQGKWEDAKQVYVSMKDKKYNERTYKDIFLDDLDAMEKEGITHPDVEKARALLRN
ncbi:MAG: tetratricopeptide repeat protein [Saprospiraceae bacterium]|nr:tetratricopeptide repeat protein [Candidatus Vicinibacter affinis]